MNNQLFVTPWNWFGSRITHRPESQLTPPAQFLCDINQEIEQVVDQFVRGWDEMGKLMAGGYLPHISMEETDKGFRLRFEAKGFEEGDLKVSLKDGVLAVAGKKSREDKDEGKSEGEEVSRSESRSFRQMLPLPQNIREEGIEASYQDGVLTIDIPKILEVNRSRQIAINGRNGQAASGPDKRTDANDTANGAANANRNRSGNVQGRKEKTA